MRARRTVLLILGMLLVVVIALMVLRTRGGVELGDGSRARLVRVSYGYSDELVLGSPMERTLGRILPSRAVKRLGWTVSKQQRRNEALFLWFEVSGFDPGHVPGLGITVANEHGLESGIIGANPAIRTPGTNDPIVFGFVVETFPRRARHLAIQLHHATSNGWSRAGSIELKNPGLARNGRTQGKGLPQTRREGDIDFTLVSVAGGLAETNARSPRYPMRSELELQMRSRNAQDMGTNMWDPRAWTVRSLLVTNHNGNGWFEFAPYATTSAGQLRIATRGSLWPDEAWTISLQLSLLDSAQHPAADLVIIPGIPIPARGETNRLNVATNWHGVPIRLHSIAATPVVTNTSAFARSIIPVTIYADLQGTRTAPLGDDRPAVNGISLARALDDRGRLVRKMGVAPQNVRKEIRLVPLKDAKSMDLVLQVERGYGVEFAIGPGAGTTDVGLKTRGESRKQD